MPHLSLIGMVGAAVLVTAAPAGAQELPVGGNLVPVLPGMSVPPPSALALQAMPSLSGGTPAIRIPGTDMYVDRLYRPRCVFYGNYASGSVRGRQDYSVRNLRLYCP